jgi:hypothetical protein
MNESVLKRFFAKIEKSEDGHWYWTGGLAGGRYPFFENTGAHRLAYEHFVGPIKEGYDVHHTCLVTCCVNPEHLEQKSRAEHNRIHHPILQFCKNGHEMTEKNTYIHRTSGERCCRMCHRIYTKRYRDKRMRSDNG